MFTYVLQQLGYGTPLLIVYLIGIILAAVFVRKYPFPAMLTAILFINIIAIAIVQGYFIRARIESGWSAEQYLQITTIVSAISGLVRAVGTALLIGAIFVGRKVKPAGQLVVS